MRLGGWIEENRSAGFGFDSRQIKKIGIRPPAAKERRRAVAGKNHTGSTFSVPSGTFSRRRLNSEGGIPALSRLGELFIGARTYPERMNLALGWLLSGCKKGVREMLTERTEIVAWIVYAWSFTCSSLKA